MHLRKNRHTGILQSIQHRARQGPLLYAKTAKIEKTAGRPAEKKLYWCGIMSANEWGDHKKENSPTSKNWAGHVPSNGKDRKRVPKT
jgi:hypothetical protein